MAVVRSTTTLEDDPLHAHSARLDLAIAYIKSILAREASSGHPLSSKDAEALTAVDKADAAITALTGHSLSLLKHERAHARADASLLRQQLQHSERERDAMRIAHSDELVKLKAEAKGEADALTSRLSDESAAVQRLAAKSIADAESARRTLAESHSQHAAACRAIEAARAAEQHEARAHAEQLTARFGARLDAGGADASACHAALVAEVGLLDEDMEALQVCIPRASHGDTVHPAALCRCPMPLPYASSPLCRCSLSPASPHRGSLCVLCVMYAGDEASLAAGE